jgi:hypothetical protein
MQAEGLFSICFMVMVFGGFIGLVVALVVWQRHRTNKIAEAWKAMAEDLGLSYSRPSSWQPGTITGAHMDFQIQIYVFTRGSGKNKTTLTAVKTFVNPQLSMGLKISREHMFSGLGKMLGFQDIQTGDKEFDDRFVIKGKDEPAVHRFLTPGLRQEILRYDRFASGASISDEGAYWEKISVIKDPTLLTNTLAAQSQVVRAMSQAALNSTASDY